MYRVLMGVSGTTDATYKAATAMKKGDLVVKGTNGEVAFPAEATDKNVFLVGKELYTTGANGDVDLSDYAEELESIAEDEGVTAEKVVTGNVYFTTQATGTFTVGQYAIVGTAGLLTPTATAGKFVVRDTEYTDCGHAGIVFEVLD